MLFIFSPHYNECGHINISTSFLHLCWRWSSFDPYPRMNIGHIFSYRNWVVLLCLMFGVKEKFDFFCDTLLKLGDIRINQSLVGKSTFYFLLIWFCTFLSYHLYTVGQGSRNIFVVGSDIFVDGIISKSFLSNIIICHRSAWTVRQARFSPRAPSWLSML